MDEFDPLSLFSAAEPENPLTIIPAFVQSCPQDTRDAASQDDSDTEVFPIHILDMPSLSTKPPAAILLVLLKLLAPNQQYNFATKTKNLSTDEILVTRGLTLAQLEAVLPWLSAYAPSLSTVPQLLNLSQSAATLLSTPDFMNYITRIISSPLLWIDEEDVQSIQKEASLRLSENCGRTAQPEIIRQITLEGLEEKTGRKNIVLKEPSLTADNLGLKTWGSSLILSQRLLTEFTCKSKEDGGRVLDEPVLELGSGTGLVGMMSGILGYATWLTDLPEIVPNLRENVRLNELSLVVEELDWSQPQGYEEKHQQQTSEGFMTILISDPIYSSRHPPWVVSMCSRFLRDCPTARVYLQIPVREKFEAERANLWRLMEVAGFETCRSELEDGYDDFGEQLFVFKEFKRA
ncbi:hypothetical protein BABINDRAFT_40478 [Babjeviella inositovora NRRL Y-12698]|uniref:Uncharacterized protein n=1 Tax=Babjeviella inositovora NRRL Y-12698 TaxID=984486 RepID=A0A1E3QKN3_9ASCO|nr:uncharacterized protein BABINDRAFT_40478 [Babjeviella inositovora NRRL Y-12698]ODQ78014.1 hypothetical protein BABINDRAFT_40478 [Babjeviella inositovora NRRL Y-12698]